MKRAIFCLLILALLLGAGREVRADLIINGSFESPALPSGGLINVGGGGTAITGWTVQGSDVNLLQTNYSEVGNGMNQFNAEDGLNSIDITGNGNTGPADGIEQTVATTPGQTYFLSFYVGRAASDNGNSAYLDPTTVDLSIDGGPRTSFTNSLTAPSGGIGWEQFDTSFIAAGSSTTITFLNGTPAATSEAGLDNVSLVPEPPSIVLLAIGLLVFCGLGLRRWRRRASGCRDVFVSTPRLAIGPVRAGFHVDLQRHR